MKPSIREQVWERAGSRCEYCQMPESGDELPFHLDHIIPRKHRGSDDLTNLAVACFACSTFKGYDISGIDKGNGRIDPTVQSANRPMVASFSVERCRTGGIDTDWPSDDRCLVNQPPVSNAITSGPDGRRSLLAQTDQASVMVVAERRPRGGQLEPSCPVRRPRRTSPPGRP